MLADRGVSPSPQQPTGSSAGSSQAASVIKSTDANVNQDWQQMFGGEDPHPEQTAACEPVKASTPATSGRGTPTPATPRSAAAAAKKVPKVKVKDAVIKENTGRSL